MRAIRRKCHSVIPARFWTYEHRVKSPEGWVGSAFPTQNRKVALVSWDYPTGACPTEWQKVRWDRVVDLHPQTSRQC